MDPYKLIGQAVQNASAPGLNFLIAQRELLDRQIQDQVKENQMAADQENAIDRIKLDNKLSRKRQGKYQQKQYDDALKLAKEKSKLEQAAAEKQARAMLPGQTKVLQFHMAQMEMADRKIDNLLNQDSDLKQAIDRLTVESLRAELNPRDFNVIVKNGQIDESAFPKLGSQQKRVSKIYKKARENALFDAQQQVSETSQPLLQQVLRTYGDEYLANSKAVGELMTKNPLLAENIDGIMVDYFKTAKQAYRGGETVQAPVSDPVSQVDAMMGDDVPVVEPTRSRAGQIINNLGETGRQFKRHAGEFFADIEKGIDPEGYSMGRPPVQVEGWTPASSGAAPIPQSAFQRSAIQIPPASFSPIIGTGGAQGVDELAKQKEKIRRLMGGY